MIDGYAGDLALPGVLSMFFEWLEQFLHHLVEWSRPLTLEKFLGGAVASAFGLALVKIVIAAFRHLWHRIAELVRARKRIKHALWAVSDKSPGVWLSSRPQFPGKYEHKLHSSIPIMTIANLKGGVGKTTVAANLAAHYAYSGQRLLLIDLDFQGSFSSMMLNGINSPDKASKLISVPGAHVLLAQEERLNLRWVPQLDEKLKRGLSHNFVPNAFGVPAFYPLARTDNRLMVEWLLGCYSSDPRYWLAETLLDPEVQARYDRVIIDAPPRMVAGCVQALCASTCVVIPTVLDQLSSDAVDRFITQLEQEKQLWPQLKVAGITATTCSTTLASYEADTIRKLIDRLERHAPRPALFWKDAFITENSLLSRAAGHGIAYAHNSNRADFRALRYRFSCLADAIERGLRGERTYEAWQAWLIDEDVDPGPATARSNGSRRQHELPLNAL
jgi:chromosome partitioning protein